VPRGHAGFGVIGGVNLGLPAGEIGLWRGEVVLAAFGGKSFHHRLH
jgi:hypothetical protein